MNSLDKFIAVFAPQRALQRERARRALRIYDGASAGRRGSSWRSRHSSANTEIAGSISKLRDRARDLARNTPHANRILDILISHAVGVGLRPVPTTGSDGLDKRVTQLWNDWSPKADVEGVIGFDAMQCLAVRGMIEGGEIVLRFIDRRPTEIDSPVPLQLQLLEADFIDETRDGFFAQNVPGTARTRLGVGLGDYDRRTGLWLWPYHPGELATYTALTPKLSFFAPRDDLIHMYRVLRPGQVRGVTWFAPILTTSRELSDFMDAVVVKSRVEACFAAFVTNPSEFDPILDEGSSLYSSLSNPEAMISTLEPGMIKDLRPGQDIKFANPTPTTQAEPIIMNYLMAVAAGMGVTYDQLSGDLRGANYSSLRAGKLDFRRFIEQVQFQIIIPMLCEPVWKRFISRAIMAGVLTERRSGYPVQWITPAWEPVNPKFDLDAEQHAVRSLRISPQEYTAAWGNDWRDVQDQTKEYYERLDSLGLVSDLDPRKTSRAGQAQKVPGTTGPGDPAAAAPGAAPADQQPAANGNGSAGILYDVDGNEVDLGDLTIDESGN